MVFNNQKVDTPFDPFVLRKQMVEQQIVHRGIRERRVLEAMLQVPRELFLGPQEKKNAYEDRPLPIAMGQTISQPYIVAKMSELLDLSGSERVLEIGSGCGYQLAVLSLLAKEVFGVELHASLVEQAKKKLTDLGRVNATVFHGNGREGLPEKAPFDRILVSCASSAIELEWGIQLRVGGVLVFPKELGKSQVLFRCEKSKTGWKEQSGIGVKFVPLL